MGFDTIKKEIAALDDKQLADLAALVSVLRKNRDPEFRAMLERKMDQPREAWIDAEELDRRYGPLDLSGG